MKRLLFILLLLPLFVKGQGGYSPTTPTGSTSFSPTFRYKTHVTDSTLYIWLQANGHYYPISTVGLSGGGGSFLPLAGGIMTGKIYVNTNGADSLGLWFGNGAHGFGSDKAGLYAAQPTTDHTFLTLHLDDNAHGDWLRGEININSGGGAANNKTFFLWNLDKLDNRSDSTLLRNYLFFTSGITQNHTIVADSIQWDSQITDGVSSSDVGQLANGASIGSNDIASGDSNSINSFTAPGGETGFSLQTVKGGGGGDKEIYVSTGTGAPDGIQFHDSVGGIGPIADASIDTANMTITPKMYVTSEWVLNHSGGGGSTINFTNGLNQDGADARLGGTLTEETNIDVTNHDLEVTNDDTRFGISGTVHLGAGGFETDHTATGFTNQPGFRADEILASLGINNIGDPLKNTSFGVDTVHGYVLQAGTRPLFRKGIQYSQLPFTSLVDSSLIPRKYAITLMDSVKATISGGSGTVTSLTDNTTNGVAVTWATRTTTPVPTVVLGAITPTSVFTNSVVNTSGGDIWYFGDSVTAGNDASPSSNRYSTLLAGYFGLTEHNNGISGTKASDLVLSTIPTKGSTDRFIVIEFGTNEVLNSVTPATYTTNMQTIITNVLGKGWPASSIIIPGTFGSFYTSALNSAYIAMDNAAAAVAATNGCVYVSCYTTMRNSQTLTQASAFPSGAVHPNNEGHLLIARNFESAMQPLYNTGNGQAQISNGINELKSLTVRNIPNLSDDNNSFPLGTNATGQVGYINSLRNGMQLNTTYLKSNLIGGNAYLPSSFSGNDIILPQPTKIFSTFSTSLNNYLQIGDANLYMNFVTNYSAAKFNWMFSSATLASIDVPTKTLSLAVGSTTSKMALVGGKIKDYFADAGNTSTTETDLYSYTTEANMLNANGNSIKAQYSGIFVSSATATRELKVYFGGTAIFDSAALTTVSSSYWDVNVSIIRVSSTVVRYSVTLSALGQSDVVKVGELTGLTLSSTNILKVTGQAASTGAATNDIVAKMGTVFYSPAGI